MLIWQAQNVPQDELSWLMHNTIWLLDEPLSSLDTEVRINLQEAIRAIQRELGGTTIFVTHDLGEAMAMSDRMACC